MTPKDIQELFDKSTRQSALELKVKDWITNVKISIGLFIVWAVIFFIAFEGYTELQQTIYLIIGFTSMGLMGYCGYRLAKARVELEDEN